MSQFTVDLKKAIGENIAEAEKSVRGTLNFISANIIKRTPVGDPRYWKTKPPKGYIGGTLRNAWNPSKQSPDLTLRTSKARSGAAAIARAAKVANSVELGETFYLTNPQPYANRVEYGWSQGQAPRGMVRVSIAEANQVLRRQ